MRCLSSPNDGICGYAISLPPWETPFYNKTETKWARDFIKPCLNMLFLWNFEAI